MLSSAVITLTIQSRQNVLPFFNLCEIKPSDAPASLSEGTVCLPEESHPLPCFLSVTPLPTVLSLLSCSLNTVLQSKSKVSLWYNQNLKVLILIYKSENKNPHLSGAFLSQNHACCKVFHFINSSPWGQTANCLMVLCKNSRGEKSPKHLLL